MSKWGCEKGENLHDCIERIISREFRDSIRRGGRSDDRDNHDRSDYTYIRRSSSESEREPKYKTMKEAVCKAIVHFYGDSITGHVNLETRCDDKTE